MLDYRKKMDLDEARAFISKQSAETKVYIGGDSARFKSKGVWYADYTVVAVVHIDGCRGCRVFGEVTRERDFDSKRNKPTNRLMTEVYKVADLFLKLREAVGDRHVEVHLDVNSKKGTVSNEVVDQAVGYIRGTCNVVPMIKPDSPAASFCADRYAELKQRRAEAARGTPADDLTAAKLRRKIKKDAA